MAKLQYQSFAYLVMWFVSKVEGRQSFSRQDRSFSGLLTRLERLLITKVKHLEGSAICKKSTFSDALDHSAIGAGPIFFLLA